MQYDKARVVIRERGFGDILDLALLLIREHPWQLLLAALAGMLPFYLINAYLLDHLLDDELATFEQAWWYLYWSVTAMVLETPLATAPVTLYLGQAMFLEKPSVSRILRDLWRASGQLVLFQLVLRGVLASCALLWLAFFVGWPYLNEVILLEQNPLISDRKGQQTTWVRSGKLHGKMRAEILGRWLLACMVGGMLGAAVWGSLVVLHYVFAGFREPGAYLYTVYFQLAAWLTIGYFSVVRFLSYLDLRIRSEGWEVELAMRAEAARMQRQLA
jgi:hypothetical protein